MKYLIAALVLAAFSNSSALTPAKPTPDLSSGSVKDSRADDAEEDDLVYASIKVEANSNVRFEVEFKRSTFVFGSSTATFFLDTDQKVSTGYRGLDAEKDRGLIGVDALVQVPLKAKEGAVYYVTNGDTPSFKLQDTRCVVEPLPSGCGYYLTLPLKYLGTNNPYMKFKVRSRRITSPTSMSEFRDTMPDIGQQCGEVKNPIVATQARHRPMKADPKAIHFKNKWYWFYLEKKPWSDAKKACANKSGQLAVVPDAETWGFLYDTLIYDKARDAALWLGATDGKAEGTWEWIDGTPFTFTAWRAGQPDNAGRKENYLHTWGNGWNDANNGGDFGAEHVAGYICEWEDR